MQVIIARKIKAPVVMYAEATEYLELYIEMAEKIYSGLKKSLSKRIAEVDLDRFSKDKYTREPEDPMED